jgi:hypothetical protein
MELSELQSQTLNALLDRIIPKDDFPSATENGVGHFVQHILQTDMKHRAEEVRLGLIALNDESIAFNNRPFTEQSADDQDHVLRLIEASENVRAIWPIAPTYFFELLVRLTHEGYYSDPSNGANVEEISWRMIGYESRIPANPTKERWLENNS